MAIHEKQPHFALLPFLAQGHLIPMVDIARLLAKRGVHVTILITPHNENRVRTVIDRAVASGLKIQTRHLRFPCAESGLPEGTENFDMLPSVDDVIKFFKGVTLLENQVQEILQEIEPSPSCLIADFCFAWATNVALNLRIPRIMFHGMSCFSLLCMHMLWVSKDFEYVDSDTEYFVLPDLPDRIEITKAQIRGTAKKMSPDWVKVRDELQESEKEAFGTVANTFEELEPEYAKQYVKVRGKKVWCIGPVSLCNEDDKDKAERGSKAAIDESQCLKWLDSKELRSVIYVCLGSSSSLATSQLIELGLGLESSNRPFIWVVRKASDEFMKWLVDEKFEERIQERGFLIHGWAPQVLILSHPSVGGFLTHCGWNSTLEGITAGRPMVTWPVFAEQFCNEKFVVNVIKTGLRVGVEMPVWSGEEESMGVQVRTDDIKRAVDELMDGGEEGRERRERAWKLGETTRGAMVEGGSSYANMTRFVDDVIKQRDSYGDRLSEDDANRGA